MSPNCDQPDRTTWDFLPTWYQELVYLVEKWVEKMEEKYGMYYFSFLNEEEWAFKIFGDALIRDVGDEVWALAHRKYAEFLAGQKR